MGGEQGTQGEAGVPGAGELAAMMLTPAGELVLDGAESQAAAGDGGAVNEVQVLRAKLNEQQTRIDLMLVKLDNLVEHVEFHKQWHEAHSGDVTGLQKSIAEANVRLNALEDALCGAATPEECGVEVATCTPRVRQCLEVLAEEVEALGGNRTVNLVRNTLDGVAAGG